MNRAEIRELVIEATGRSDKESLINSAIDIAVAELSSQRLWLDLSTEDDLAIVANDLSVALPTDMNRLTEARLIIPSSPTLSRPLLVRPKSWVVDNWPNITALTSGKPAYAYLESNRLFFAPKSDASYTIRITYYRLHPALSSDSSEILIRHGSQAVIAYATFWVFKAVEKKEDSDSWLTTYATLLATAMKVDGDNTAIKHAAIQRGSEPSRVPEYWLDPFAKRVP